MDARIPMGAKMAGYYCVGGTYMPAHQDTGGLMRVTVIGGSGVIGQELVEDLVFRGYRVTVVVPQGMPVPQSPVEGVEVVTGRLDDPGAVDAVVAGRRAVISTLDPRQRSLCDRRPLVEATAAVVAGMLRCGTVRYLGLGSPVVSLCPR